MHHAAVDPDLAVLGEHVVDGHFTHLGHDLGRVVCSRGLHGIQVVKCRRIIARVGHRRHALGALEKALGPLARFVVAVPVEAVRQRQALGNVQPHGIDIRQPDEQACERLLAGLGQPEFVGRLHRIDKPGSRARNRDDFGPRALRLQQERRVIRRGDRIANAADDLATVGLDRSGRVGLERMAEGVISGQEEPCIATLPDDLVTRPIRQRKCVVRIVDAVGRTGIARDAR